MTFTDYVVDLALIGIVVLQVRGRRLTLRALVLPLILVAWAAATYLKSVPTAGNDLVLIGVLTAAGAGLGLGSGLTTRVRRRADGTLVARAGMAAAALWVLGMGFRLAFQLYASHGGADAIGRFSVAHQITSAQAWVAALILMALAEAVARTAVITGRAWQQGGLSSPAGVARSGIMTVGEHVA